MLFQIPAISHLPCGYPQVCSRHSLSPDPLTHPIASFVPLLIYLASFPSLMPDHIMYYMFHLPATCLLCLPFLTDYLLHNSALNFLPNKQLLSTALSSALGSHLCVQNRYMSHSVLVDVPNNTEYRSNMRAPSARQNGTCAHKHTLFCCVIITAPSHYLNAVMSGSAAIRTLKCAESLNDQHQWRVDNVL